MIINSTNLLRRTLAVLGAGIALTASLPAASQGTVTLSGATSNNCAYSTMTVSPNGNIIVTCTGVTQPTGAVFSVTAVTYTTAPESSGTVMLKRTGGTGPLNAMLAISASGGAACDTGSISLPFADGQTYSWPYQLHASGTCTISLTPDSPHTAGSLSIPITTSGGGGTNGAGCPTPPSDYLYQTMDKWRGLTPGQVATSWDSVDQLRMKSGQIATYDVPNPGSAAIVFTQGQQPASPTGSVITEMTVSKCKGVIDPSAAQCYSRGTFVNNNQIKIYRGVYNGWNSQELVGDRGCFAPANDPNTGEALTWYVSVRWTFSSCQFGIGACGFSMQWGGADPN